VDKLIISILGPEWEKLPEGQDPSVAAVVSTPGCAGRSCHEATVKWLMIMLMGHRPGPHQHPSAAAERISLFAGTGRTNRSHGTDRHPATSSVLPTPSPRRHEGCGLTG
jgi:hypothetical protein